MMNAFGLVVSIRRGCAAAVDKGGQLSQIESHGLLGSNGQIEDELLHSRRGLHLIQEIPNAQLRQ